MTFYSVLTTNESSYTPPKKLTSKQTNHCIKELNTITRFMKRFKPLRNNTHTLFFCQRLPIDIKPPISYFNVWQWSHSLLLQPILQEIHQILIKQFYLLLFQQSADTKHFIKPGVRDRRFQLRLTPPFITHINRRGSYLQRVIPQCSFQNNHCHGPVIASTSRCQPHSIPTYIPRIEGVRDSCISAFPRMSCIRLSFNRSSERTQVHFANAEVWEFD